MHSCGAAWCWCWAGSVKFVSILGAAPAKVRPLQQLRLLHSPLSGPQTAYFYLSSPGPATCHRRPHNRAIIMTDLCLKQQPDMYRSCSIMHTYWDVAVADGNLRYRGAFKTCNFVCIYIYIHIIYAKSVAFLIIYLSPLIHYMEPFLRIE